MDTSDLTPLISQLAQLALRNTASAVHARVRAARTGKQHEEQINELTELINELVDERNELVSIARSFEQELAAQQISAKDIKYINDTLIPAFEHFTGMDERDEASRKNIENVKEILSVEMLTVMQLLGFNYKRAIGEPLTTIVQRLILSQVPDPQDRSEIAALQQRHQNLLIELARDPKGIEHLEKLQKL